MSPEEGRRKVLGRGLSALLGDMAGDSPAGVPRAVAVARIRPNRLQPRRQFDAAEIEELAASLKSQGVLQPVVLRPDPDRPGDYELVVGERRWRAAQAAQIHDLPAVIKDFSDREALEAALVENLQRRDLTALEEAAAYRRLMSEFNHTQERLAEALGKSRSYVANLVRLNDLPDAVKEMMDRGELSAGHARVLLGLRDPLALARRIAAEGLNVRQAERLAARERVPGRPRGPAGRLARDADTAALERRLEAELGLKVNIRHQTGGKSGTITFAYRTLDQLDDLLKRLGGGRP
ncbi:MAG: ParB/RepB/Spo0J family partition protein [Pseudomonadota bacterium]